MATTKRKPQRVTKAVRARRLEVAKHLRLGRRQVEIAAIMSLSPATISRDTTALQEEWNDRAPRDMQTLRNRDLKALDEIDNDARCQFAATGKVQWLRVRLDVMRRRAQLCGYDQPMQFDVAITTTWRNQPIKDMTAAELQQAIASAQQAVNDHGDPRPLTKA